jgi:hypothetical protein
MGRALALTLLVVVAVTGCGSKASSPATEADTSGQGGTVPRTSATDTVTEDLPRPVVATRDVILDAAAAGDYQRLRTVLDQEVFLSDYGFGDDQPDPVAQWEALGPRPLETMGALLRMRHVVRETNEGTLYQWPRLDPDSTSEDMSASERELFLSFMSERELEEAFNPDYGYTAPRIGILADGTWWFFIAEAGP